MCRFGAYLTIKIWNSTMRYIVINLQLNWIGCENMFHNWIVTPKERRYRRIHVETPLMSAIHPSAGPSTSISQSFTHTSRLLKILLNDFIKLLLTIILKILVKNIYRKNYKSIKRCKKNHKWNNFTYFN